MSLITIYIALNKLTRLGFFTVKTLSASALFNGLLVAFGYVAETNKTGIFVVATTYRYGCGSSFLVVWCYLPCLELQFGN